MRGRGQARASETAHPAGGAAPGAGIAPDDRLSESYKDGKKTNDTSGSPKFTEGFGAGQVGLAWNGQVVCFIHQVTIKGKLDSDWVSTALGEKAGDKKTGGKK